MAYFGQYHPFERDAFLRAVAGELAKYPELGEGIISRVCSKIQRQHLAPRGHIGGKWSH